MILRLTYYYKSSNEVFTPLCVYIILWRRGYQVFHINNVKYSLVCSWYHLYIYILVPLIYIWVFDPQFSKLSSLYHARYMRAYYQLYELWPTLSTDRDRIKTTRGERYKIWGDGGAGEPERCRHDQVAGGARARTSYWQGVEDPWPLALERKPTWQETKNHKLRGFRGKLRKGEAGTQGRCRYPQ